MRPKEGEGDRMRKSLLETVAEHEEGLLAEVSAAEEEGRGIVETAQAQAATTLSEAYHEAESEIAELRRKAGIAREKERLEIEEDAVDKVRAIREESADKRSAVVEEFLGLVLPGGANT